MTCGKNRLIVEMKQGEQRNFSFTIRNKASVNTEGIQLYEPFNLNNCTIEFDIKEYPFESVTPLIHKEIDSNQTNPDGYILEPTNEGKFVVYLYSTDTENLNPDREYVLVITLIYGDTRIIISADDNNSGVFRFCKQ